MRFEEVYGYNGAWSGAEVDAGIGAALEPETELIDISSINDSGKLVSTSALVSTLRKSLIVVTISGLSATSTFTKTYRQTNTTRARITADHIVIHAEMSNPAALNSDLSVVTGDAQLTISGTALTAGLATDIRIVLAIPYALEVATT